jgi:hypothetical protein
MRAANALSVVLRVFALDVAVHFESMALLSYADCRLPDSYRRLPNTDGCLADACIPLTDSDRCLAQSAALFSDANCSATEIPDRSVR